MSGNLLWLFFGFATGWTLIFLYLFLLSRKERELRRRVADLEELLKMST